MEETSFLRSWRDILRSACETPQKKQALAEQVGFVSVRTIDRWISGDSNPQKSEAIRKLATTGEEMAAALKREFPEAFYPKQAAISIEQVTLPSEFYRRVAHAYAHVPLSSRRWTIFHLLSNQMIPHLDPERAGLVLIYVRNQREAPQVIQFEEGAGNAFWTTRQVQGTTEADMPLMQAIAAGEPFFIQSCSISQIPSCLLHADLVRSIGFFPIFRSGMAGGGLLLCSTQEDFFTPLRQALIEEYSCLFALALSDSDFSLA